MWHRYWITQKRGITQNPITMKTKTYILGLLFIFTQVITAQDRTTVRANSVDISDNLDLRAIASIFGESKDLSDFEQRLNDPSIPISNLDLNNDNQVDYLRVLETVEGKTHLIIIQAVLGYDVFQDVATVEIEKDKHNKISIQVVGDVYMYGSNYIYEPVYVRTPVIYSHFWTAGYVAYYSPWYWSYYPNYYYAWKPFPIYRYKNHIHGWVNINNTCHYVTHRKSTRAIALYTTRRSNGYEVQHPTRSFTARNTNIGNRYELIKNRESNTTRGNAAVANRTSTATRLQSENSRTIAADAIERNQSERNTNTEITRDRTIPSRTIQENTSSSTRTNLNKNTARNIDSKTATRQELNTVRNNSNTVRSTQNSDNARNRSTSTPSVTRSESKQNTMGQNARGSGNSSNRTERASVSNRRG